MNPAGGTKTRSPTKSGRAGQRELVKVVNNRRRKSWNTNGIGVSRKITHESSKRENFRPFMDDVMHDVCVQCTLYIPQRAVKRGKKRPIVSTVVFPATLLCARAWPPIRSAVNLKFLL